MKTCQTCGLPLEGVHLLTKYHPGECAKRAKARQAQARREQQRASETDGYIKLTEFAADMSVTVKAVRDFYKRRKLLRRPYIRKFGQAHYLRFDVVDLYTKNRSAVKPKGAVTFKSLQAAEPMARTILSRQGGGVVPLRFRQRLYIDAADAKLVLSQAHEFRPLPGWVSVADLASRAGIVYSTLIGRVHRAGLETRLYKGSRKVCLHVLEKSAEPLLSRHIPLAFDTALEPHVTRLYLAHLSASEIASAFGLTHKQVQGFVERNGLAEMRQDAKQRVLADVLGELMRSAA